MSGHAITVLIAGLLVFPVGSAAVWRALVFCREERKGSPPGEQAVYAGEWQALLSWVAWHLIWLTWRQRFNVLTAAVIVCVFGGGAAIAVALGMTWFAIYLAGTAAVIGGLLWWPAARRRIIAWAWCVVIPFRVWTGCIHAWRSDDSRLPTVLDMIRTECGERVVLWCLGITARRLAAVHDDLVAAFWARDVRVVPSRKHPRVVVLDVIRDPTGLNKEVVRA